MDIQDKISIVINTKELEVDMISLNVLLNTEDGRSGLIRFKWPVKGSNHNGDHLWATQYPLSLEDKFSGSLVYGKAEWKRRRRSEEDEIWVMEIGKSVHDWLASVVQNREIDLGELDAEVMTQEAVSVER